MDMGIVGHVESLWRYPVKSMRGEELAEAFIGFAGVYGDRLYAFKSSTRPAGFPYLTGREQEAMLLYRPRFRHPDQAAKPPNLAAAEAIAPGITPLPGDPAALAVEVETPAGEVLAVDDPTLTHKLGEGSPDGRVLTLLRSERAMTDCRPISLFSMQTARQLAEEIGIALDQRRFRANVYLDLSNTAGFAEDGFVGRSLRTRAEGGGRGPRARPALQDDHPRSRHREAEPGHPPQGHARPRGHGRGLRSGPGGRHGPPRRSYRAPRLAPAGRRAHAGGREFLVDPPQAVARPPKPTDIGGQTAGA